MRTRTISKVSRWIAPFLQILLFSAALLGTEAAFAEDNPPARVARISYSHIIYVYIELPATRHAAFVLRLRHCRQGKSNQAKQ